MAKNNFKAKEATGDAGYAGDVGTGGQDLLQTGAKQQATGFGNLESTLGRQRSFADMLQSAAAGTGGPSLADQQIKDATSRNNANAAGFAAGAKGLNPALAARQALSAQAGNNQQAAGQAAQTRIQEMQAARSQLGGALAGEAATGGAETQAGLGAAGTGGGLANQSNANLISSRGGANQINADVAKQNAGAINGAIGGVLNAAGGAFGLAEGGVVPGEPEGTQSDETSIALAKGGMVPHAPSLPSGTHGLAQPHRSFAAQVAHHLSREYFAEGGMAESPGASDKKHEPYNFKGMNLRDVKKAQYVPHDTGLDATATGGTTSAGPGKEGTDSEGREKKLRLAEGGEVDEEETNYERQVRMRREGHDRDRDRQTENDMASLEKASKPGEEKKMAEGGMAGFAPAEKEYDPEDDEELDNTPDTDADADQADAQAQQMHGYYADGGDVSAGGGDESAGLSMAPMQDATGAAHKPSVFQQMGDRLKQRVARSPMGSLLGGGAPPAAPVVPTRRAAPAFNFEAGGPVPGKAKVDGNSLKNDTVPAQLSPGEVVLPRSISHDPHKAKAFVEHLLAHGGSGHQALKDIKKKRKA